MFLFLDLLIGHINNSNGFVNRIQSLKLEPDQMMYCEVCIEENRSLHTEVYTHASEKSSALPSATQTCFCQIQEKIQWKHFNNKEEANNKWNNIVIPYTVRPLSSKSSCVF